MVLDQPTPTKLVLETNLMGVPSARGQTETEHLIADRIRVEVGWLMGAATAL